MITSNEHRMSKLLAAGVPLEFLSAFNNLENFVGLGDILQPPDAAYHYLPQIFDKYQCLAGWEITPICDSHTNLFYVYLSNSLEAKFVYLALEQDQILKDFGSQFAYLLSHLLIEYYESLELSITELSDIGKRLGFPQATILFTALELASQQKLRSTFEHDHAWRRDNLPRIIHPKP